MSNNIYSKYIGIPYATAHCWQLVAQIQSEVFAVDVPMFDTVDPDNRKAIMQTIRQQKQLKNKWGKLGTPRHGCIVLMHHSKMPTHAGVYIKTDLMAGIIHTNKAQGSHFTSLSQLSGLWNITGYYMPVKGAFNDD